jgi:hypothetical protein
LGYLTTNLQPSALSFMLFWTLFYGLVYLYDWLHLSLSKKDMRQTSHDIDIWSFEF